MVKIVALIPARGGSKSIPRKNIKALAGVPLIAYSIAAGLRSKLVERVIVSTDDAAVAEIARAYGAEVPFMRPAAYAQDDTVDLPVFQHALDWLTAHDGGADVFVQLRPTSPLRPPHMVDDALRMLLDDPEADSVRGVVASGENPYKMWFKRDGVLTPLLTVPGLAEPFNTPRQYLPATYWQTGHIDVIRARTIRAGSMTGTKILAYDVDPRCTIDIDTLKDWANAEAMIAAGEIEIVKPDAREFASPDRSGTTKRMFPSDIKFLALDFDGVLTDNRVWVNRDGVEWVAAHRGDGMGIGMVKARGIEVVVISRESDPVVQARCAKLGIACYHGITAKEPILTQLVEERGLHWSQVMYVGNDANDIGCMRLAGFAAAPADAHASAKDAADLILSLNGGYGAVRELCDLILRHLV